VAFVFAPVALAICQEWNQLAVVQAFPDTNFLPIMEGLSDGAYPE
jgi:hypothetical protein